MSARYGRNKARRDREIIATLNRTLIETSRAENLLSARLNTALVEKHIALETLEEFEDRLRFALGHATALTVTPARYAARDARVPVAVQLGGIVDPVDGSVEAAAYLATADLNTMVTRLERDWHRHMTRVRLLVSDGRETVYQFSDLQINMSTLDIQAFAEDLVRKLLKPIVDNEQEKARA